MDKQDIEKLIVPRLVSDLVCSVDEQGTVYLDNVDVGGVDVAAGQSEFFLAGIINAPVANFVFRRISKPFRGDYRSANKQFIALLPVPPAKETECNDVARRAKKLQTKHTARRDLLEQLARRIEAVRFKSRPEGWLFQTFDTKQELLEQAPRNLEEQERRVWAERKREEALQSKYDEITTRLYPGATLAASFENGELAFFVDNVPVIDHVFVDQGEGAFVVAQWKVLAQTFSITEKTDGKKLCNALRKLAVTDNAALVKQIITLEETLSALEGEISEEEAAMDATIYRLYDLTAEDIQLIEAG